MESSIEEHLRWLLASQFGRGCDPLSTKQKRALGEAEQVIALLERQASPSSRSCTDPSPPHMNSITAAPYPHHVRYMAAACRAPPSKALFYLTEARDNGSLLAAAEAGTMYVLGIGTPPELRCGLDLLDAAVADGHPGAMLATGRCLRDGIGVPRDVRLALLWIERGAAMCYAPAAHELGEIYECGIDVSGNLLTTDMQHIQGSVCLHRDLVLAFRFYKIAANLGYAPSQLNIAKLFLVGASLNLDEIPSESMLKACYWLEKASQNGSLEATALLQRQKHEDPERILTRQPLATQQC